MVNVQDATKASVKALTGGDSGDWILDVRGVPWGNPGVRDSDGEYFTPETHLHEDKFPTPPAVYYHGWNPTGGNAHTPEYIGKTVSYEDRADGRWYRVVLDKANRFAQRVWDAALKGKARASAGSNHLYRVDSSGFIREWPVMELTLLDAEGGRQSVNKHAIALPVLKAVYKAAGLELPENLDIEQEFIDNRDSNSPQETEDPNGQSTQENAESIRSPNEETDPMEQSTDIDINALVAEQVAAALAKKDAEAQAAAELAQKIEDDKQAAVKAALEARDAEAAKSNRLPDGAPYVAAFADEWKFDNLDAGDMALAVAILHDAKRTGRSKAGESVAAIKALYRKLETDAEKGGEVGRVGVGALKARGFAGKANELDYSTYSTHGDEWVFDAQSAMLWMAIRKQTSIVSRIPTIEVPPGHESITIPLESTDPTWYKISQATAINSNGPPTRTVTPSHVTTSSTQLTLSKLGGTAIFSGELEEDSLIPWASNLRRQLEVSGAETLEASVIDGDNSTGATTNINDIGGTPAGTEYFEVYDGFRVSPLVTTTANSRNGGVLDVSDFLKTLQLMGVQGKNADRSNTIFIVPPSVMWKALQLPEILTRDTFSMPTIENGVLTSIWGYEVVLSYFYNWWSVKSGSTTGYEYLENTAGKLDLDTAANNVAGSFLAVRLDQWLMAFRRRMTLETTRYAYADATEITAMMRVGLIQRDTEASAITYNVTV